MTTRTSNVESHGADGLTHLTAASTLGADRHARTGVPQAPALRAGLVPKNAQPEGRAANGIPEPDVNRVFEILARLRLRLWLTAPLAKDLREQIRESAPTRSGSLTATCTLTGLRKNVRKVKAAEVEPRRASPTPRSRVGAGLRVETELIVHLPFLTIAEDAIGFLDIFEAVLRGPVPGVHIRVMLAGEPAVSLADLILAGLALDAKNPIVVFLFRRGHNNRPINLSTKASHAKRYPPGRTHRYLSGASSHSDDGGSSGPGGLTPARS